MLVCTFVCANRTRDRGCSKHPVFPAPSNFRGGQTKMQTSGDQRREIAMLYPPSLRAQRSNPPLRLPCHGLLRCARNDVEGAVPLKSVGIRSPDERSDIRGHSNTVPDVASLIRATKEDATYEIALPLIQHPPVIRAIQRERRHV